MKIKKLKYEIDLGWVVAGKADPIYWTKKYSSRIIACPALISFVETIMV